MSWEDISVENADKCANNWKHFESFGISHPEEYEGWMILYTSNRDSGLLDRSNEVQIKEALDAYPEEQVKPFGANHWACGYLDGFAVKVFDDNGELTPAFNEVCAIAVALQDYPIINEDHYSEMEYEATISNIENEGSSLFEDDPPKGWAGKVFSWLWENNQSAVENSDDQGGYASKDEIKEALIALELINEE
jgi:hypothetical protein